MGKAIALLLHEGGYQVDAAARRLDKMSNLRELGIKLLTMDFTSEVSAAEGIASVIKADGKINVLINNAGFGPYGAIQDARLIQLVLPHMRARTHGTIVNVSSIAGKFASTLLGW